MEFQGDFIKRMVQGSLSVFLFFSCTNVTFSQDKKNTLEENPLYPFLTIGILTYLSTSDFDSYAEKDIDWSRFLGTWKEIKRIDTSFQKGLKQVTAEYSLLEDGSIRVTNQGTTETGETNLLVGKALLPNPKVGKLKVSFFYPFFFGDYLILKIDRTGYQTALIGGPDPNFLWLFSRTDSLPIEVETSYIQYAKSIGYFTDRLLSFR
ncbi:lipocalin family protein [Leptospira sp. 85282-16]|uniref:lipocalin family protein n=1 Tax=Leptospira sp. 85282-16 TaxID=2971256 RepID=UPI0021C15E5B|nr:lipocalin family protein [Leptospira sp. 85282-16]MCT8332760.1 lipocalin family protein [Leptospira sp. 85282-16]